MGTRRLLEAVMRNDSGMVTLLFLGQNSDVSVGVFRLLYDMDIL